MSRYVRYPVPQDSGDPGMGSQIFFYAASTDNPLTGGITSGSAVTGTLLVTKDLAAAVASTSVLTGTLTNTPPGTNALVGSITSTSALTGALTVTVIQLPRRQTVIYRQAVSRGACW